MRRCATVHTVSRCRYTVGGVYGPKATALPFPIPLRVMPDDAVEEMVFAGRLARAFVEGLNAAIAAAEKGEWR